MSDWKSNTIKYCNLSVHCRDKLDSTYAVQGPMSSLYRHVILRRFILVLR